MKRILFIILFLLVCRISYATNWCNDANISACYTIETGSGTALTDDSSNTNNGTFKGSGEPAWDGVDVPTSSDGFLSTSNYSLEFDGANDYINVPDSADLDFTTAFTMATWVNIDGSNSTASNGIIADKRTIATNATDGTSFRWLFNDAEDDYRIQVYKPATTSNECDTTGVSFNANEWHHVTATYDNSNLRIYFDGVLENTCALTGPITTNNDQMNIGSENDDSGNHFDGEIDELVFFSDTKDATDIGEILKGLLDQGIVASTTKAENISLDSVTIN